MINSGGVWNVNAGLHPERTDVAVSAINRAVMLRVIFRWFFQYRIKDNNPIVTKLKEKNAMVVWNGSMVPSMVMISRLGNSLLVKLGFGGSMASAKA